MSSWLDLLPSAERSKIRQRLRSPAEYEKTRLKVQGPEQLRQDMDRNEQLAELSFAMESEPELKQALQDAIAEKIQEEGVEAVLESTSDLSESLQNSLQEGVSISVAEHPDTGQDQLMVAPSGNVSEKLPVKFSLSEQYVSQFVQDL